MNFCKIFLVLLCLAATALGAAPKDCEADIAVVGGGSAGFAAAWSAAKLGIRVILVEKEKALGGTSTIGGVNNWEPVFGATGVPRRVYQRLVKIPDATGPYVFARFGTLSIQKADPSLPYSQTLVRHIPEGMSKADGVRRWHGVIFEPEAMERVMLQMLQETGRCQILLGATFLAPEATNGVVTALQLADGRRVRAKIVIDATDGVLCSQLGCPVLEGHEARSLFNEPGAPEKPNLALNGVTLIYRVTKSPEPEANAKPRPCWWAKNYPGVFMCRYPCGDFNMNMCPTMLGQEAMRLGPKAAYAECFKRVKAHWDWLKATHPELKGYRMKSIAPVLAYRETRRIQGEYVLTQNDLTAGRSRQTHADIIALADHMMDSHGGGGPNGELKEEYGIPYRCLLPLNTKNVLIAGRAASFSAIAASSCRLSRTMMQLGEAAGVAAYYAVTRNVPLRQVPAAEIRRIMQTKIDQ